MFLCEETEERFIAIYLCVDAYTRVRFCVVGNKTGTRMTKSEV